MSRKSDKKARKMSREEVASTAPILSGNGGLVKSTGTLKSLRQNKHNPLPFLTPSMLTRALQSFEHGYLRESVLLWEKMAERDDMLMSVKPKREKDVSQLDMQVVAKADSGAEGEKHKEVLDNFWRSIRATNAYDRNERGGFRRLVKQMMTAVSFRYAAHHIIWTPRANGELRATFEFVPLWLFENTTGRLRYLPSASATSGTDLDDSEWMVTTGDGLMIACSIGYLAKRAAFNDWLIFSEKFSVPGVLGRTSAKAGTPEAIAMEEATAAFGHDWTAVITGDDGTHAKPIEIVQAQGNPAGMPMPAVIERVDRRMASLYRGADLSSMSSGAGEGMGASLQDKETDILRRDDAETIAETLEEVSRMVIEWYFGNGVEPLARVELIVPVQEDANAVVTSASALADRGAKVSSSALMDRLNLPKAADEADALKPSGGNPKPETLNPKEELENSLSRDDADEGLQELRNALAEDLRPLGDALFAAANAGDGAAVRAAARKISESMPDFMESAAVASLMEGGMLDALKTQDPETQDARQEVENAGFRHDQSRNLMGRWGEESGGGGGGGNWKTHGLLPARHTKADDSNAKTKWYDAGARLAAGEEVEDDRGSKIPFTRALIEHWEKKPAEEMKARLGELDDAQDAVRRPHEVWDNAGQTVYLRKYKGNGPERWMAVFVPKGNPAKTYYSSSRADKADESFRRGRLLRKR